MSNFVKRNCHRPSFRTSRLTKNAHLTVRKPESMHVLYCNLKHTLSHTAVAKSTEDGAARGDVCYYGKGKEHLPGQFCR